MLISILCYIMFKERKPYIHINTHDHINADETVKRQDIYAV